MCSNFCAKSVLVLKQPQLIYLASKVSINDGGTEINWVDQAAKPCKAWHIK